MKCESCGYDNESNEKNCIYCGSELVEPKTFAFITQGDIFDIRGRVWIAGVSFHELNVGDTIEFGNHAYKIHSIRVFAGTPIEVKSVDERKNCALYLGKVTKNELAKQIYEIIQAEKHIDKPPFCFSSEPTTAYVLGFLNK